MQKSANLGDKIIARYAAFQMVRIQWSMAIEASSN